MPGINLIILLLPLLNAVSSQPDSLKAMLPACEGHEKLNVLYQLTSYYTQRSADSCLKYGTYAIALAQDLKNTKTEALSCKKIGYSYYTTGEYDSCIKYYQATLRINLKDHDLLSAAEISNLFGDTYNQKGEYDKALDYFMEAKRSCDSLILVDSLTSSVKKLYSILFTNIGLLYFQLDSSRKSLEYFNSALNYAREIGDKKRIAASFSNIGMIYKKLGESREASEMYFSALAVSRSIGDKYYESKILNNIANIYEEREMLDSAIICIKMAEQISGELGNKQDLTIFERNLARYYMKSGRYDAAMVHVLNAIKISEEIGAVHKSSEHYKLLSELYEKQGNYNEALRNYKIHERLNDSVTGQETREKIAAINARYESEKKELENSKLRKEIELKEIVIAQKNVLIILMTIGASLFAILLLLIIFSLRSKSKAYNLLVRQNLKSLEIEKEIERSITQMATTGEQTGEFKDGKFEELGIRLMKFMIEEKPFLWSEVNMDEFCRKLNTNRTYLSKVIHDQYHQSFNDLICEFRIRASRDLLSDRANLHISVEGIGQMAGFKSNSHFHKRFKELVGITPNEFRDRAIKANIPPAQDKYN